MLLAAHKISQLVLMLKQKAKVPRGVSSQRPRAVSASVSGTTAAVRKFEDRCPIVRNALCFYLTWLKKCQKKKKGLKKICKCVVLSRTATNSRTGRAAISASAPCVCLMCLLFGDYQTRFEGGGGRGAQSQGIWRHKEREKKKKSCQAGVGKKKRHYRKLSACHKKHLL